MRISTIAGLLILTTVVLSTAACTQSNLATVVDHSKRSYGWNPSLSSAPARIAAVPQAQPLDYATYSAPTTQTVQTRELAAPMAVHTTELAAPAPQTVMSSDQFSQLSWPVQGKIIRSFGPQQNGAKSEGIAIATPYGMPIRAANGGQVAYVGSELKDFGNMLILRHEDGTMTSYAHASEIVVKKGDALKRGTLLGYVGRSGNVAEPQLHFTMRVGNQTVDPLKHLPQQFASIN